MSQIFNVYCDESCHLENDNQKAMVLGAVWCPVEICRDISVSIREIKARHGMKPGFEIKWTKVSPVKIQFYEEILDYFFENDGLHFRGLIVADKSKLQHEFFGQTYDEWYYKMYFDMLKVILSPNERYRIYLDIKDTRSANKINKLHEVLCNDRYDFSKQIIERVQTVRSHEVEIMQLADLLIGVVSYANRGLSTSNAKVSLVESMRQRSGYQLTKTTLLRENKVNLFRWHES